MNAYAFYGMKNNALLGDCVALVCPVSTDEARIDHLRTNDILLLLKTSASPRILEDVRGQDLFGGAVPLLRLASECLFGIFGDSHCDCEAQRLASMEAIAQRGCGVYVHIPQEARGRGLFYKAQELQLQISGLLPNGEDVGEKSAADAALMIAGPHEPMDTRHYSAVARIFRETGLDRYDYALITNNRDKHAKASEQIGLRIVQLLAVRRPITIDNAADYLSKLHHSDDVSADELEAIYRVLSSAERLPGRLTSVARHLAGEFARKESQTERALQLKKIVELVELRDEVARSATA